MCGIAGLVDLEGQPIERPLLLEMTELLDHRGPDGSGIQVIDNVGLGHRRLSIIDLETGDQPMFSSDDRYLVVFNGEIFNYLELRSELKQSGSCFRTHSDTEVLLEGFGKWGVGLFSRLNGQFAFALYDLEMKKTYLVRDSIGEKPLYIFKSSRYLGFASELKSLCALKRRLGVALDINLEAFLDFLSLNYVPFHKTFFADVIQLLPGSYVEVDRHGEISASTFEVERDSFENGLQKNIVFQRSLEGAVKRRLRSDVPLGLFLSGGLDSSIVAHEISKQGVDCLAYTADFGASGFSEADYAAQVCHNLGIRHQRVLIDLEATCIPDLIEKLVYHGDSPIADSSSLAVYLLSQEAAKDVKVVLSGDGGDELFAGYLTYSATELSRRMGFWLRSFLGMTLPFFRFFRFGDSKVTLLEKTQRFVRNLNLPPGVAHFAWNGMFQLNQKVRLLHSRIVNEQQLEIRDTFTKLAEFYRIDPQTPTLRSLQMADRREYLCNDILQKVDRMSMAHGLEVRPVFLDNSVVQFSDELRDSEQMKGLSGKLFLKNYARQQLPWYDLSRPKEGFSIPVHRWFRTILREYFNDLISSQSAKQAELFDMCEVEQIWHLHQKRRANFGFELWGIMVALIWFRTFIASPSPLLRKQ